jgi:prepilin-type N-terminal cleavage/methylation domain-containing protein
MRFASIGTPAKSPLARCDKRRRQAGFTLIETLVALSLLLAFVMSFSPLMFQARHILVQGRGESRAQTMLESLLAEPFDRLKPKTGIREGEDAGLIWSVDVEPYGEPHVDADAKRDKGHEPAWALFQVGARVSWGSGRTVTAQTLRLGQVE